jgi:hypothetical protein
MGRRIGVEDGGVCDARQSGIPLEDGRGTWELKEGLEALRDHI